MLKHSESNVENISDAFMQNRGLSVEEVHDYLIKLCVATESCHDYHKTSQEIPLDCTEILTDFDEIATIECSPLCATAYKVAQIDTNLDELTTSAQSAATNITVVSPIQSAELLPIRSSWKIEPVFNNNYLYKLHGRGRGLTASERIYLYKRLTGQDVIIRYGDVLTAKPPHIPVNLKTPEWAKFRNILLDYLAACKYYSFFASLPATEHYRFKFDNRELANLVYSCDILVELSNNSIFTEMFVAYTDQDLPRAKKIVDALLAAQPEE